MVRNKIKARGRKAELILAAWELFTRNGYDRTSVEAVINRSGASKGTFYHYFKSKEALLDAVVEAMTDQAMAEIRDKLPDSTGPAARSAIDRLNVFLGAARSWRLANLARVRDLAGALYRDENAVVQRKTLKRKLETAGPVLAEILAAGAEAGVFRVSQPVETAELVIRLGEAFMESSVELYLDQSGDRAVLVRLLGRLELYFTCLERMLAAPEGSLARPDLSALADMLGLTGERS